MILWGGWGGLGMWYSFSQQVLFQQVQRYEHMLSEVSSYFFFCSCVCGHCGAFNHSLLPHLFPTKPIATTTKKVFRSGLEPPRQTLYIELSELGWETRFGMRAWGWGNPLGRGNLAKLFVVEWFLVTLWQIVIESASKRSHPSLPTFCCIILLSAFIDLLVTSRVSTCSWSVCYQFVSFIVFPPSFLQVHFQLLFFI